MKKFDIRVRLFAVLFALVFAFGIAACGGEERENETPAELSAEEVNSFSEEFVNLYGRTYIKDGMLILDHAATAIEFGIYGKSVQATLYSPRETYVCVFVDDDAESCRRIDLKTTANRYSLFNGLDDGYHKIRIVKSSEAIDGETGVMQLFADKFAAVPKKSDLKIEFIGDSITAGYGITGSKSSAKTLENSDATLTYAYVAASKLGADYSVVAVSGICTKVVMYQRSMDDVYGKVSVHNDEEYAFDFDPDVVVINLGGNDATYIREKDASYAERFSAEYYEFLQFVREKNPNAYIVCIHGMMGADATILAGIRQAVSDMNDANDDRVVVFEDYTMNTSGSAGHPSFSAQEIWGETFAEYVKTLTAEN